MAIVKMGVQDDASEIKYDNTNSGLVSVNVNDAIDEIVSISGGPHTHDANTLTGDTLSSNVLNSSLTSVGSLNSLNVGTIKFIDSDIDEGELYWDGMYKTLELTMGDGVYQQIGEELFYPKNTFNNTGSTITKGTPVMFTGYGVGDITFITPAIADNSIDGSYFLGVATVDIPDQTVGRVTYFGGLLGLDTSAWPNGTFLYISDTTPGMFVDTPPISPSLTILAGMVAKSNDINGIFFVRHHSFPKALTIPYDNDESSLVGTNVKSVIDELQAKKAGVDMLTSSIMLYPTTTIGDFGYTKMVTKTDDPAYNTTAVGVPVGPINSDNQLIDTLIADAGLFVGNPGIMSITTFGNISKTSVNKNQYCGFYFTFIKRELDSTETVIGTSHSTGTINPNDFNYHHFNATALIQSTNWLETDRIVIKYYADLTGSPGATYNFEFGGFNPVRTPIPVPISVMPSHISKDILVDTTNFTSLLGQSDDDIQSAFETLDTHTHIETNDLTTMVTWDIVPNSYISESSVTQHQSALTLTMSQISDIGSLDHTWGDIEGTLSNQTDLQSALDDKMNAISAYTLPTIDGPSGYVLKTDGSGNVSWQADISAGTPAWGTLNGNLSDQTDLQSVLDNKMDDVSGYTLPDLDGPSGYVLKTDGSGNVSWQADISAGTPAWGTLNGNLSDQTDLQSALDLKASSTHNHDSVYEPADVTILKESNIGIDVQAFNSVLTTTTASFTISDETKLDNIEDFATADQVWGEIGGDITNQTDLQNSLNSMLEAAIWQDSIDNGWNDLTASLMLGDNDPTAPNWTQMGTTVFYGYNFDIDNRGILKYHMLHDYKPGGNVYIHVHWTTSGITTNTVKWQLDYTVAKGYNQSTSSTFFQSVGQIFLEEAASGTAWQHMVTTTLTSLPIDNMEPDSIIMVALKRVTNGIADNNDDIFYLSCDIHYEVDRHGTLNKQPDFYS